MLSLDILQSSVIFFFFMASFSISAFFMQSDMASDFIIESFFMESAARTASVEAPSAMVSAAATATVCSSS